ncbi:MAG: histidine kinase, partial [Chloroflexi bacterium]
MVSQVRDAIFALSMTELQEGGLVSVLYTLIRDLREATSIEADLVVSELAVPLPPRIESALLTIAQEALSNVRRHAQATIVIVTLQVTSEQAMLVVQDNGIGLSQQVLRTYRGNATHLGLKGMRNRLEELDGQ